MKNFDPYDLSPRFLRTFTLFAMFMLIIWIWLSNKPYEYDGAKAIAVDNDGVVHIQVGDTLYRLSETGQSLPEIDLSELGVGEFMGDMSFNAQNELLLVRGSTRRGMFEQFVALFSGDQQDSVDEEHAGQLALCDLAAMTCKPFTEADHDISWGYFSTVDKTSGDWFISDSSRHLIRKFDQNGQLLATLDKDLMYTSEMLLDEGALYLLDTRNETIRHLSSDTDSFGKLEETYPIASSNSDETGFKHPTSIAKLGNYYWVSVLDIDLEKGAIYLFDEAWAFNKIVALEAGAMPTALLSHAGEMWVTDIQSNFVSRYSASGELLGWVEHSSLNQALLSYTEKRDFYKTLQLVYLFFIALAFLILVAFVIRSHLELTRRQNSRLRENSLAVELDINAVESLVEWLPLQHSLQSYRCTLNSQRLGLLVVVVLAVSLWLFSVKHFSTEPLSALPPMMLLMLASCGCFLLFLTEKSRVRLGVRDHQLVLHDQQSNRVFAAEGKAIVFDGHRIAVGSLSTGTRYRQLYNYKLECYAKSVYPLLANASVVAPGTMLSWIYRNEKTRVLHTTIKLGLFLIVMLGFAVVMSLES